MIGNDREEFLKSTRDKMDDYFKKKNYKNTKSSFGRTSTYLIVYPHFLLQNICGRSPYRDFNSFYTEIYLNHDEKYNIWILEHISPIIQKQLLTFQLDKILVEFRLTNYLGEKNKMYVVNDKGEFYFEKYY